MSIPREVFRVIEAAKRLDEAEKQVNILRREYEEQLMELPPSQMSLLQQIILRDID